LHHFVPETSELLHSADCIFYALQEIMKGYATEVNKAGEI